MEPITKNLKKSRLLFSYFEYENSKSTPEESIEYAVKIFLDSNNDENEISARSMLDQALEDYSKEENLLNFYHPKVLRLLADVGTSAHIIQEFSNQFSDGEEFNRKSRALWREVSAMLSNGVQLYWMYFPDTKKKKDLSFREYRAELLRSAFDPHDDFMKILKAIRNVHVHFDEYMDDIFVNNVTAGKKVVDQAVGEYSKVDLEQSVISRLYDPTSKILYHLGRENPSPTKLFSLNIRELSGMAASIMNTFYLNMGKPGWRFRIRLDVVQSWGDSHG